MHESKTQIRVVLSTLMKTSGYRKRSGLTWHKQTPDTILVVHVEKNRWGANRYDIDLGIYVRVLGEALTPPINHCQILASLETLVPDIYEFRQVCDFDYLSFTTEERLERLKEFVAEVALPWLEQHSTLAALEKMALSEYQELMSQMFIIRATYDYLRGRSDLV
jgi:hypothetical protein